MNPTRKKQYAKTSPEMASALAALKSGVREFELEQSHKNFSISPKDVRRLEAELDGELGANDAQVNPKLARRWRRFGADGFCALEVVYHVIRQAEGKGVWIA